MITGPEIFGILLVSILLSTLFYYGLNRTGPWGSIWSFILVVFLGVFVFDIFATPVGPLYLGIAWLDLLLIGLIFALLLAAATPKNEPREEALSENDKKELRQRMEAGEGDSAVAIGAFFWILIFSFITTIAIGTLI